MLLQQETLHLRLEGPYFEQRFVVYFFFLGHEGLHEEHVVLEVKELHAQLQRYFLLENVNQLLPVAEVENCDVGLHAERIFICKPLSKVLHLQVVCIDEAKHVMDGFVSQQGAGTLLLHQDLVPNQPHEISSVPIQVTVLGAHEDEVAPLPAREPVALAHHQRHMVKLEDFERVEDQIDKVLVNVVHLNDEVSLVNCFVLLVLADLEQNTLALELAQLLPHLVGPQTKVVDYFLSDHILHISIILLLVYEVDLLHCLAFGFLDERANKALDVAVRRDDGEFRTLAKCRGAASTVL